MLSKSWKWLIHSHRKCRHFHPPAPRMVDMLMDLSRIKNFTLHCFLSIHLPLSLFHSYTGACFTVSLADILALLTHTTLILEVALIQVPRSSYCSLLPVIFFAFQCLSSVPWAVISPPPAYLMPYPEFRPFIFLMLRD